MTTCFQKIAVLVVLAVVPGYFLLAGGVPDADSFFLSLDEERVLLEERVRAGIPFGLQLQQLGLDLRMLGGQREQNRIFISNEGLMRNIDPPIGAFVEENVQSIGSFAQHLTSYSDGKVNTYLAVIPTAGGVLQQNLPRYAQSQMVDQQRQIEDAYRGVITSGVRTVDAYSALYNRREQYIYYRTDNSLTALGGYYVYVALGRRLGLSNRSLSQFGIEYVDHAFYGDLYQAPAGSVGEWGGTTAPYRRVQPDTISLFRYHGNREYLVTRRGSGEEQVYHTLYPKQKMELGNELDIYLGGASAVTEIRSSGPYVGRLLILGDKSASACLPFLVNHYQRVTLVDLYRAGRAEIAAISPEQYDAVLFVYGIESFIHTNNPAQVKHIRWAKTE